MLEDRWGSAEKVSVPAREVLSLQAGRANFGTRIMIRSRARCVVGIALVVLAVIVLMVPLPHESLPNAAAAANAAATEHSSIEAKAIGSNQFVSPTGGVLAQAASVRELSGGYVAYAAQVTAVSLKVYDSPSRNAEVLMELGRNTEHGQPQTLLIVSELYVNANTWFKVRLPVRPNGSTGWISSDDVRVIGIDWTVNVYLSAYRLEVLHKGQVAKEAAIGVGTQERPTPGGTFSTMELLQPPNPNTAYGKYTYVLNGYSNVVRDFNGGPGLIGIHGTNDPERSIGRDVSSGCIRMTNEDITELASMLPLGTPVHIFA